MSYTPCKKGDKLSQVFTFLRIIVLPFQNMNKVVCVTIRGICAGEKMTGSPLWPWKYLLWWHVFVFVRLQYYEKTVIKLPD